MKCTCPAIKLLQILLRTVSTEDQFALIKQRSSEPLQHRN